MIALVAGDVAVRRPDHVVIEAAGVGYRLAVSSQTLRQVPAVDNEALLSLTELPQPDHAADALAVAVCHANGAPMRAAV